MKLNKIFLLGCIMTLGLSFTSCSDDDDWAPGKAAGQYNVTFADEADKTLSLDSMSFEIILTRTDSTSELTVPLNVIEADPTIFTSIPSSVTFNEGKNTAIAKIGLSDAMESFVDYTFSVSVPEEYTNPYKDTTAVSSYKIIVSKDDWKDFAIMQTNNWAWTDLFGMSDGIGQAKAQYSEYLGLLRIYKFMCYYTDDAYMYIQWDGDVDKDANVKLTTSTGTVLASNKVFYTGIPDEITGVGDAYYLWMQAYPTTYKASTKTFSIPVAFYVKGSSGYSGYGGGYDYYTILSLTGK